KLDDDLRDRLGSLRFEVSGLAAGMLPVIYVDENVNPVAADAPFPVNPGRHVVVAKTPARQIIKTIDARERSTTSVALDFGSPASRALDWPWEASCCIANTSPRPRPRAHSPNR